MLKVIGYIFLSILIIAGIVTAVAGILAHVHSQSLSAEFVDWWNGWIHTTLEWLKIVKPKAV